MSKKAIIDFLQKCVVYSDESILRKIERGDSEEIIQQWQTYRDFTNYSIDELNQGKLDDWFQTELKFATDTIDLTELDHSERAKWLSAILSPRPLALVLTNSTEGKMNLAPITSLAVVSNSPSLIVMSLSQNREGQHRDTYQNMIITKKCQLQFLNPTLESAIDADICGTPTEKSEWELIGKQGPIHPLAIATLSCTLLEDNPLPDGAVARLLTLRVDEITIPAGTTSHQAFSVLCQHGIDTLTPSPNDWTYVATLHRS
jgi:flavin reductase (DIM6/NTAB) family NADH-FMN oxidoreductase RutF